MFIGKQGVLYQAFKAHHVKIYAPAITCFLTILDFVLLEIAGSLNSKDTYRNANRNMLQEIFNFIQERIILNIYVNELLPESDKFGKGLYVFQIESLLIYMRDHIFENTERLKDKRDLLNRHGIIHGKSKFFSYPNEFNSNKLILLLDELILLYKKTPFLDYKLQGTESWLNNKDK